jgi:tripartite-type tricarboxylate transporter receptor subunit TctC
MRRMRQASLACALLCAAAAAQPGRADPVEDFYKGREVSVIVTGSPGSNYEIYARLITHGMSKFLPGHPGMVIRSMNGGGHVVGTNYLYNVAPKDGSVLGAIGETMALTQILQPELVKFDAGRFNWIGNPNVGNLTLAAWYTAGIDSIQQVTERELIVGASGPTSPSGQIPRALNNILGTKFKIIIGFPGSSIDVAMERGEVAARGSAQIEWWRTAHPDWLAEKKIRILLQVGLRRDPGLPDVPLLTELARNDAERQIFKLLSSTVVIGRPLVAPPDVPTERVTALRAAFGQTMKDPEFLAEARKVKLEINPVLADELQGIVEDLVHTPPEIVTLAKAALAQGRTFNCGELVRDAKLCQTDGKSE